MTESQRKAALSTIENIRNGIGTIIGKEVMETIYEALQAPQVEEVTVDQLVLRFKLTNAEYLINQLSFDHPHGIRIIREKSDEV